MKKKTPLDSKRRGSTVGQMFGSIISGILLQILRPGGGLTDGLMLLENIPPNLTPEKSTIHERLFNTSLQKLSEGYYFSQRPPPNQPPIKKRCFSKSKFQAIRKDSATKTPLPWNRLAEKAIDELDYMQQKGGDIPCCIPSTSNMSRGA